jgi:4'-phosphopantetheinyl transferase
MWLAWRTASVELWLTDLDEVSLDVALTDDERRRAASLRDARDGARWAASRRVLRAILAVRIGARPTALRFAVGPYGKPEVAGGPAFSLARSGRWAAVAVGDRLPIGVDIELVRRPPDMDALLSALHPDEASELRRVSPARRLRAVLTCWTRKEAYVKARGTGLSVEPAAFRVTTGLDEPPRLLSAGAGEHPERWWLVDGPAPGEVVVAIAGRRDDGS